MVRNDDLGWQLAYRRTTWLLLFLLIVMGVSLITLPVLAESINWQMLAHEEPLGNLVRDFGFAILIAGSAGVGYEYMLRNAFSKEVEWTLTQIINERSAELDQLRRAGVKTVYRRLAHATLIDHFETASRSIRILQTWSGDFNQLGDTLARAAMRGCEIKILLLNPESFQAEQRGKDLGYVDSDVVKALIQNDLEVIRKCSSRCGKDVDNIKIRLYDATPVIPIYGYDDTNVMGIYWHQMHSQEGPQLEVYNPEMDAEYHHSTKYLAEAVAEHFDALWNSEQTRELKLKEPGKWEEQQGFQLANAETHTRTNALGQNGPHKVLARGIRALLPVRENN